MESKNRGVLDTPHARGMTVVSGREHPSLSSLRGAKRRSNPFFLDAAPWMAAALLRRLDPFGGASPQRVAIFGPEKTEMADLGRPHVGRRDGEDLRLGRDKACAKQFDRRPRRPWVIGKAQRAHRAIEL